MTLHDNHSSEEEILLQRLRFYAQKTVSAEVLAAMDASFLKAIDFDGFIATFVANVWGQENVLFEKTWPVTWRDAVKDRWFPKWLKKRYPPEFQSYRVAKQELLPTLNIPLHASTLRLDVGSDRFHWEEDT
jgi:hypothetical protein